MTTTSTPVVMVFAGSDPTGGAGITADIQTLSSLGCHPAPVVTAVTAQDTNGLKQFTPVDIELVIAQARAVLEDMPVAAFKIGMLANAQILSAIATIVDEYRELPLVLDPVLATDAGEALAEGDILQAMRSLLLPRANLITPNSLEARRLATDADTLEASAQELLDLGCDYVLLTGTHEATPEVIHRLYAQRRLLQSFSMPRLQHQYHGSGCTLAAACAAGLAHGVGTVEAVTHALNYTQETLAQALRQGMGQLLPNRLYWCHASATSKAAKSD